MLNPENLHKTVCQYVVQVTYENIHTRVIEIYEVLPMCVALGDDEMTILYILS